MDTDAGLRLCYLDAAKVQSPSGHLEGVVLESDTHEPLGTLNGVVIEPAERRLRYFVVERRGWLKSRRYLVPADQPAHMADDHRTLQLPVNPAQLTSCQEFDASVIPEFSDEDLVTAMFAQPAA